jgi:hypothetical protein
MSMSTGYEESKPYQILRSYGEASLPYLIENISRNMSWWRSQMICELTALALDQCIYFEPGTLSQASAVQERIVAWWAANGQAAAQESAAVRL